MALTGLGCCCGGSSHIAGEPTGLNGTPMGEGGTRLTLSDGEESASSDDTPLPSLALMIATSSLWCDRESVMSRKGAVTHQHMVFNNAVWCSDSRIRNRAKARQASFCTSIPLLISTRGIAEKSFSTAVRPDGTRTRISTQWSGNAVTSLNGDMARPSCV